MVSTKMRLDNLLFAANLFTIHGIYSILVGKIAKKIV